MVKINKLLIIVATHGDEKIGIAVVKILGKKGYGKYFDYLVANPRALKQNKRFIDFDLNRAYPGRQNSPLYEMRQARKNLMQAKNYRYIIDIHEASAGQDNFIIVPRRKISSFFPLEFINLRRVLLWPSPKGPMSQILKNAVELEFGMRNKKREVVVLKASKIIGSFIMLAFPKSLRIEKEKEFYYVYGKLLVGDGSGDKKLKDFRMTEIEKEKFYPLLVGQYEKEGIVCYKMKKL